MTTTTTADYDVLPSAPGYYWAVDTNTLVHRHCPLVETDLGCPECGSVDCCGYCIPAKELLPPPMALCHICGVPFLVDGSCRCD